MKLLENLNLDSLYVRHGIKYYCHNHPSQNDNFNAALKELAATLQDVDWIDVNGVQVKTLAAQNIAMDGHAATIVVSILNDGEHDIQAADVYTHLFDSSHVHFTENSIDHANLLNAGNWSHFEIEDGLKEIRNYLGRDMLAPNSLAIVSPSLSVERYEGMPCVKTTDNTYIGFKISVDGDTYWRNSLREVYVEFVFLDAGGGQIQTCWNYDGGSVVDDDLSEAIEHTNSGLWKKGSFDGELRFFGDFTSNGNADFLLRGTAGIALNAVRVYVAEQSWMNAKITEGCRICEWKASL